MIISKSICRNGLSFGHSDWHPSSVHCVMPLKVVWSQKVFKLLHRALNWSWCCPWYSHINLTEKIFGSFLSGVWGICQASLTIGGLLRGCTLAYLLRCLSLFSCTVTLSEELIWKFLEFFSKNSASVTFCLFWFVYKEWRFNFFFLWLDFLIKSPAPP